MPTALASLKQFRQHCLGFVEPSLITRYQAIDTELARRHLRDRLVVNPVAQTHDELVYGHEGTDADQVLDALREPECPAVLRRRAEVVSLEPFLFAGRQRGWVEEVGGVRRPFGVPGRLWPACWRREVRGQALRPGDLAFEEEELESEVQLPRFGLGVCAGCVSPGRGTHACGAT